MADEKVIISIEDKVDSSISTKLTKIAAEARNSHSAIQRLQAALNSLQASKIASMSASLNSANATIQKLSQTSERYQLETQKTAIAQQRLQREVQKTQVAFANTETSIQRMIAAESRAAASADRAAIASLRLQQAKEKAANSENKLAREAENLKRQLYPLYDAQQTHNRAVERAQHLFEMGSIDARTYADALARAKTQLQLTEQAQEQLNRTMLKTNASMGLQRHHLLNLGFQLQDIGVSLASGQNPLTVFVQQGAQIQGIAQQAGVGLGAMAKAAAGLVLRLWPIAAALGTLYASFKLFTASIAKPDELKNYAKELGATSEQIKRLELDTVTFTDTLKGLWKTIDDRTGAGDFFSGLWDSAVKTFKNILGYIATSISSYIAIFQSIVDVIKEIFARMPSPIKNAFVDTANAILTVFETMTNGVIKAINKIIEGLNLLSKVKIDPFGEVSFKQIDKDFATAQGGDLSQIFVDAYVKNLKDNEGSVSKFISDFQKNASNAAKERIEESLGEDVQERREVTLAKINAQLDNEIKRLNMLRPQREAQQKLDQIEERLLGRKIKLNEEEKRALMDKIQTVQKAQDVQKHFDRIYDEAVGPLREYNATIDASNKLLQMGAISKEWYARETLKASEAYADSIDPLRQMNIDLSQQHDLLMMLPKARETEARIMQITNDLISKGIQLSSQEIDVLREKLNVLREMNLVAQEEANLMQRGPDSREQFANQIKALQNLRNNPNSGFTKTDQNLAVTDMLNGMGIDSSNFESVLQTQLEQQRLYYDQLTALRDADLISESEYNSARAQLWAKTQEMQFASTSKFFGQMSQLQNSESKRLQRIGKAAAISKAIVDTYTSATGAYAAMSSIPYVGPALGAAAAAAAIAAGMANVQAIRSQPAGFMKGGYTGNGGVSEVAGVVHGREFVMDAGSTSRLGVQNLEALRSGAAEIKTRNSSGTGGVSGAQMSVEIHNYGTSKQFEVEQLSPSEIRVIARDEAQKEIRETVPDLVAGEIAQPNSKISKSLARNTQTQRQR